MKHLFFFTPTLNGVITNKGVKQVVISTQDQEKQTVTIVLSIAGNRAKLKPYFIFCGNSNSENLYNRINEITFFKEKKAYFSIIKN